MVPDVYDSWVYSVWPNGMVGPCSRREDGGGLPTAPCVCRSGEPVAAVVGCCSASFGVGGACLVVVGGSETVVFCVGPGPFGLGLALFVLLFRLAYVVYGLVSGLAYVVYGLCYFVFVMVFGLW